MTDHLMKFGLSTYTSELFPFPTENFVRRETFGSSFTNLNRITKRLEFPTSLPTHDNVVEAIDLISGIENRASL